MTSPPFSSQPRLALLVDGENLSCALAAQLEAAVAQHGRSPIARVYGDAQLLAGWERRGGYVVVHSGSGKNAADLRLCIDAMDLAHRHKLDGFAIASSDGDFGHLAHYLREAGFVVIGIGEAKTPQGFRLACTRFDVLQPTPVKVPEAVAKAAPIPAKTAVTKAPKPSALLKPLDRQLRKVIMEEGTQRGIAVGLLGTRMHELFSVSAASTGASGWRQYIRARSALFACDPKGPNARVRWIGPGVTVGA